MAYSGLKPGNNITCSLADIAFTPVPGFVSSPEFPFKLLTIQGQPVAVVGHAPDVSPSLNVYDKLSNFVKAQNINDAVCLEKTRDNCSIDSQNPDQIQIGARMPLGLEGVVPALQKLLPKGRHINKQDACATLLSCSNVSDTTQPPVLMAIQIRQFYNFISEAKDKKQILYIFCDTGVLTIGIYLYYLIHNLTSCSPEEARVKLGKEYSARIAEAIPIEGGASSPDVFEKIVFDVDGSDVVNVDGKISGISIDLHKRISKYSVSGISIFDIKALSEIKHKSATKLLEQKTITAGYLQQEMARVRLLTKQFGCSHARGTLYQLYCLCANELGLNLKDFIRDTTPA
jgi:hypothetical protein